MKGKKLKSLIASIFAFSLFFGAGAILVTSKVAKPTYAEVKREGEAEPGDESQEPSEATPQEDTSENTSGEAAKESGSEASSESTVQTEDVNAKNIFKALGKTFRDAWLDLIAHIKKWFKK